MQCSSQEKSLERVTLRSHLIRGEALLRIMEINAEKLKKIEKKQHEIEVAINRLTYNVERLKRVIEAANL